MITNDGEAAGTATGAAAWCSYARAYPAELKAAELACLKRRRAAGAHRAAMRPRDPVVPGPSAADAGTADLPLDTVGLALSGGGIRSATFCLGLLQALRRERPAPARRLPVDGVRRRLHRRVSRRADPAARADRSGRADRHRPRRARSVRPVALPLQWLRDHGTLHVAQRRRRRDHRGRRLPPQPGGDSPGAGDDCAGAARRGDAAARLGRRRGPELLPALARRRLPWSPFLLAADRDLLLASVPFGWGYWFIQRDKDPPASDLVAARTAVLIALSPSPCSTRSGGRATGLL